MDTTRRQSVNLMHGHNRNIHGKVFGGEIMRLSYELAYVTAVCFLGKGNTRFSAVDDINFIRPVEVGSIMVRYMYLYFYGFYLYLYLYLCLYLCLCLVLVVAFILFLPRHFLISHNML